MTDPLQSPIFLEQYKHFRNWVGDAQKQRDDATRFAIIANGALGAWIIAAKSPPYLAFFLPLIVTVMLFLHWRGLRRKVLEGGAFIARLEALSGLDSQSGAELEYRSRIDPKHPSRIWRTRESPVWIALFLFGVLFPLIVRV